MAKTAKFLPVKTSKGNWRLSVPPKYSQSGKREQYFYKTQALAKAAADLLRSKREEHGTQAKAIAPGLAEMATAAADRLKPFGVTITDVVNLYIEERTRQLASVPIESALEHFKLAKDARSDSQQAGYKMMGDRLSEDFAGRSLASLTAEELENHIETRTGGPSAFNQKLSLISAFLRWSAKPPRTWCDANVMAHIERKETVSGHIGTLTPKQCRALMEAAEAHFPECVPAFVIGLFTGMRQKEIARLEPKDITPDGITVPATSSKTKRRRFIAMPEPLAAWLKVYPIGESVTPPNWSRKDKAVRRLAGFAVWSDLVPAMGFDPPMAAEAPDGAPEWIDNGLRHTAATVALALGKSIETLVFEHGHSGGLAVLRNHYIGQMTRKSALEIWSIGPHGTKLATIAALSRKMAALCDIYVNDAFGTAHRAEATTYGIAQFAPVACAGPLLAAEVDAITKVLAAPRRPLVAIVAGSKVSTKLTILQALADKVDGLVVGGGIANTFLLAAGLPIGKSLAEPDLVGEARAVMASMKARGAEVPIPTDVVVATRFSADAPATVKAAADVGPDDLILDIGPATAKLLADKLMAAGTIVWNGPVGVFEFDAFAHGTETIARAIAASPAFSIAGGGDTVAAIVKYGIEADVDYISTGGGAFLEMLEGKTLPALEILSRRAAG